MSRPETRRWGWLALAAAATLAACKDSKTKQGEDTGAAPVAAERPECPLDSVLLPVKGQKEGIVLQRTVAMAGPITDIPEFHDCQRFVQRDGQHYDSLYAIFASNNLDSLARAHDQPADSSGRTAAYTAATIYSWEGTYEPLHIRPRFNCLYLWRTAARRWEAFIFHAGDSDAQCREDRFPGAARTLPLRVRVTQEGAFEPEDYPRAARWDWDPVRKIHFIGIACGLAWCEVTGDVALTSPQSPGLAAATGDQRRVHQLKGWHDYQWLAERDPTAPPSGPGAHRLRPFAVRAMVVPDPSLGSVTDSAFSVDWVPVATVYLDRNHPVYEQKYNFKKGENLISYHHAGGDVWKARIRNEEGVTKEFDVIRRDHTAHMAAHGLHVPAAARWRWKAQDETVWARCLEGCCEVVGDNP